MELKAEYVPLLSEAIYIILNVRWTALVLATQNEVAGELFRPKLAFHILSFFTQSKGPFYADDLKVLLKNFIKDHGMAFKDKSPKQVAQHLIIIHEELLRGDLKSIERLRKFTSASEVVSRSQKVVPVMNEDDDESSGEDEAPSDEETFMKVDEPKSMLDSKRETMVVDDRKQQGTIETDDEWSVVSSRRNKGKRR
ncbi:hypothetical protein IFM89_028083 [Coptis chinensis]|uniref:Uncharacterized protein n=1 Tax=Coptis chinensis TaxID=261450 RepID=A0A835HGA7_9MAGN|nr:hypothetical protein IFM89_028083 [Coptis chinensis]